MDRRLLAVFWIGLDNFSAVSDEFAAAGADEWVVESAARISRGRRPVDTLARVGTSEFAALVEGIARPTNAERAAHRSSAPSSYRSRSAGGLDSGTNQHRDHRRPVPGHPGPPDRPGPTDHEANPSAGGGSAKIARSGG